MKADSKLEDKLSKYFKILKCGSKKCSGRKINPKVYLKKLIGKKPVYTKPKNNTTFSECSGSFFYTTPPTEQMVKLSQLLWDKNKKEIDKLIKLL